MSKYVPLWEYVKASGARCLRLTFEEIARVLGFPLDHSFLNAKKELTEYGYIVSKISLKEKTVVMERKEEPPL